MAMLGSWCWRGCARNHDEARGLAGRRHPDDPRAGSALLPAPFVAKEWTPNSAQPRHPPHLIRRGMGRRRGAGPHGAGPMRRGYALGVALAPPQDAIICMASWISCAVMSRWWVATDQLWPNGSIITP